MTPLNIRVTKMDGTREPFNADRINRSIERVCFDFDNTSEYVTQLGSEVALSLYDGITTEELDQALINTALQNVQQDMAFDKIATRLLLKLVYKQVLGDYDADNQEGEVKRLHAEKFPEYIKNAIERGVLDKRMEELFDLDKLASELNVDNDSLFNYSGLSTLVHRYTIKKSGSEHTAETPQFAFMRIAMGLSWNEDNPTEAALNFYRKFSALEYLAGGSTNLSSGTSKNTMSNCFLIEMQDDMEHIAKTVADVLLISKASGGIGLSLTQLRATGSELKSTGAKSSGPIPFAKIFDNSIRAIIRGGKKKGALAAYMEVWHYDFEQFIELRTNAGDDSLRFRTANTACLLNDEFMKRVENGGDWYMFDPNETRDLIDLYGSAFSKRYAEYCDMAEKGELKIWKKAKATEIYRKILVSLVGSSHPWITWKCPMNLRALNDNTGTIKMSNLCTEICLPESRDEIAVCNLCSVNLVKHIKSESRREIDWLKLKDTVRLAVRHLDNLIDVNFLPVEEAKRSDKNNRAVGIGAMGVADLFERFGLAYDSKEAADLIDKIFEFISYHAISASADLARERGSYPNFKGSAWSRGMVPPDTLERMEKDRGAPLKVEKGSKMGLDWDSLRRKVKGGMRNATLMAIAPNANIGLVAGTTPGIDVRFAQIFSRKKFSGKYIDVNPNLVKDLKMAGVWEKVSHKLIEHQGDIADIEEIPDRLKTIYKTSFSTSPYAVLEVASRAQKWVDQGISRNMYLETRNIDELMRIYRYGWELGLKTTYYLHMKPRHTAEQSTIKVNKAKALGKSGFGVLKTKKVSPFTETKVEGKGFATCPVDPALRNQCDSCQ